jgi:colanic acid/amylovoran biosynthesis glycosyltransferase
VTNDDPAGCSTIQMLRQQGFECHAINKPYYTEERVRWILKKLSEEPPDVFVPNLIVPACYAGKWAREAGIPTVGVLHSDEAFYYGLLDEFVLGREEYRLSALVCVSKFLEQVTTQKHPEGILIKRIPCGVQIPSSISETPDKKLRIVYVGRLTEKQKRISDLTRSLCKVVNEVPGTEAKIYGAGPSVFAVKKIINRKGKGLHVSYAGKVNSDLIQERLCENHVIVLLSDYEGLPVSLMEAMACGLVPVCLNMRSGIPELVENNVTGLIVNDRGDDFVTAIRKLKHDKDLWKRLSQAARAKIQRDYNIEICVDKWVELFQELKGKTGRQRKIIIPDKVSLPSPHPDLLQHDKRTPPLVSLPFKNARKIAGKTKRRIIRFLKYH